MKITRCYREYKGESPTGRLFIEIENQPQSYQVKDEKIYGLCCEAHKLRADIEFVFSKENPKDQIANCPECKWNSVICKNPGNECNFESKSGTETPIIYDIIFAEGRD